MGDDWIEPREALRILIGAAVPANPALAEPFSHGWWFDYPKSTVQSGVCTEEEFRVVLKERDRFYQARRAGKIRASGVFNGEGRREPIEPADISRGKFNVQQAKLDCSLPGHAKRVWLDVLVSRRDIESLKRHSRNNGGRPLAADWEVAEYALRMEVGKRGLPGPENEQGWRTNVNVVDWMRDFLKARQERPKLTTLKDRVGKMLRNLRAETNVNIKTRTET